MREDVWKLMNQARWTAGSYREVAEEEHQRAVGEAWPLIAAVNRRLPRIAETSAAGEGTLP